MDRGRRRTLLIAAAAGALIAAGAPPLLVEMRWLAEGQGRLDQLARRPGECLRPPADAALARSVETGRAAFRTPLLLGGPAARAGLSCDSCHRDGRGNPAFLFPGVSGAPGTADVTTSLFSSHRGNGADDPVPIPDLSGPKAGLKVSQDPTKPDLERFIAGLVVEEFNGHPPPPAVLRGLADYVRALDPDLCPEEDRPATAEALLDDADRAVVAALTSLSAGDPATALVMIAAARSSLGRIAERYAGLTLGPAALARSDRALAAAAEAVRAAGPDGAARLAAWRAERPRLAEALAREADRSLFNPARLAALAR
ncbi:MAG TPA: hypothetical protein VEA44_12165 [Caulobacter sp.]|nr:hypothetical protein [Caulobacter sp.]